MSEGPLVIFHADCYDGFTAAWAFWRWGPGGRGATYVPAKYGEEPPLVRGRDVWILDFSYPRQTLVAMAADAERIRVFDHHETARGDLAGLPYCSFDMNRSGCGLVYDALNAMAPLPALAQFGPRPWLIDTVEDRDLWRFALPGTREAMAWVSAQFPWTFERWDALLDEGLEVAARNGVGILRYIRVYGEKARAEARLEFVGERVVPTINVPYLNCSEHIAALAQAFPDRAFAAGYFRRADGRWQFSLRSVNGVDVAAVAAGYGGGGHKAAAGFVVNRLPWEPA